jgi:hypothetical protein
VPEVAINLNGPMCWDAHAKFLACLDACTNQKRHVSHKPRASNCAPKVFAAMRADGEWQGHGEQIVCAASFNGNGASEQVRDPAQF